MSGHLSIRNRQRVRRVNLPLLRRITGHLLHVHFPQRPFELCLHLVGAKEMARVNQTFLQHEGSTDVITFDHAATEPSLANAETTEKRPLHGELYLCLDDAVTQARAFKTSWAAELVRYMVHGLLHLDGHDDLQPAARRRMKRVENQLVTQLAQTFSLDALARRPRSAQRRPASPKRAARRRVPHP